MKHKEKAKTHKELEGLILGIDSFGKISTNMSVDKLNEFLNKNVKDKKLKKLPVADDISKAKVPRR